MTYAQTHHGICIRSPVDEDPVMLPPLHLTCDVKHIGVVPVVRCHQLVAPVAEAGVSGVCAPADTSPQQQRQVGAGQLQQGWGAGPTRTA